MPNDNPAAANNPASSTSGGASSGTGSSGTAGANPNAAPNKAVQEHPAFVGFIFPASLNEDGSLKDEEPGRAHFLACVYPFDPAQNAQNANVHALVDKTLGQPFFSAFIYPNPFLDHPELDLNDVLSGGPGGHAILGGVEGREIIYLGQFHALIPVPTTEPDKGASGGSTSPTGPKS